jgi:outer membrane protein assembly factor BamB
MARTVVGSESGLWLPTRLLFPSVLMAVALSVVSASAFNAADKTAVSAADKAAEKTADKTAEKTADKTADKTVEATAWAQWRGPRGDGHAVARDVPTNWDASAVKWRSPLPGKGQSTPIQWGDRIFLTTALEDGRQREVLGISAVDGKILWRKTAWTGEPEKSHAMNGWASATCATNGEVVVAFFGKGGLHAYTVDGEPLWSRDLGPFEGPWSTAACPMIVGDLVIQNGDADADAFLEAFDLKTGKSIWRQTRPNHRGWSTPIVWRRGDRAELVLNGHAGVVAYDPAKGTVLWSTKNSSGRGEPTVTPAANSLYVVCGLAGEMYSLLDPLQPSGIATGNKAAGTATGDTAGAKDATVAAPAKAWGAMRRGGRDLSSPLVIDGYLLVASLNGIASCYEAASGKELWKERLNGQFSSTPIAVDGLALYQNEAGETTVIKPGPKLEVVSRNTLAPAADEIFRASLTPVAGRIYSRSDKVLYCIGK